MNDPRQHEDGPEDADLVARSRRGDVAAFSELVRRHQRSLTARAIAATRSVSDADELVQEAFLRAWTKLGTIRDDERFGAFLRSVLRNLVIDRARRAWRERPDAERIAAALADDAPGPDRRLLDEELSRALGDALRALPDGRQREVFRMRYVDGLPVQEIADRLGVHSGTVKTHLFRTTRRLRALLSAPGTAR